ncbi:acyl- n-acyltransferase [Fusarium sporotrichioides]|uniref:Acyl-n-acyltransferase n=1 Tax=Fusarium sporotrichioides TaxID=5514 RepID=A0A395STL1_FUSSP|nr:acyl- n-acyltransferase [Fusarium sporotrichioides]
MSWAPTSSSGAGKENTPSPNLSRSLMRVQGMRQALNPSTPARQQLFPSDVLKSRLNSARQASGGSTGLLPHQQAPRTTIDRLPHQQASLELVCAPQSQLPIETASPSYHSQALLEREEHLSQHSSARLDSQEDVEFEQSSRGTWHSPKEMAPSSVSTDVQGAPLPAPLHIIEAIGSTSVAKRRPSFSTASLALSGCPILPDEKENQPLDTEDAWGPSGTTQNHDDKINPNARIFSAAAVDNWNRDQHDYPIVPLMAFGQDPRTYDCDINPETGELIEPVRYIKLQKDGQAEHDWRRTQLSSGERIRREIVRREVLREEVVRREQEEKYANPSFEEDKVPDAACTLRPVGVQDFQAIADIINLERQQGQSSQVYLPKVDRNVIGTLYNACLHKHRPFIVAIPSPGRIPDRTNWSKAEEEEYQEFLKFKKSRETSQPTVLGFAVITDVHQGFLEGTFRGSRFSGNIKVIVHPQHRKKLVGTALLDKILSCVNIYHRTEIDYTWDCAEPRQTYEYVSAHNLRKYNKVYAEFFSVGENGPEVESIQRLLTKFDFEQVAQFKDAVKHGNEPGVWRNLNVWELSVRPTSEINELPDDM